MTNASTSEPARPSTQETVRAEELLGLMARVVKDDHVSGVDGFCVAATCRRQSVLWPCHPSKLAKGALGAAAP